ncbi:MAG: murein biosynthesis integral membrane protein MurJ [Bdellovibrionaceae bacterium]|nr:murein biosynthesis integral membrane protein MurJ [Pseudobdellovibrionaceae bacterium]
MKAKKAQEPMKNSAKTSKNSVVKSAIYFAFGTLMSRFAGLIREAALVAVFDATISDAWQAAFRFPNLFRRIFGEGALSVCFIPVYVDLKEHKKERERAQLTAGILGLLLVILVPLTVGLILSMDQIIPFWVGGKGFAAVPGKIEMTIMMTKIMFPFLVLVSLYAYFMALLNAHKKFMLTAFAPSLLNFTLIGSFAYAHFAGDISILILGLAVLLGGALQVLILLPTFFKLKIPYEWSWKHIWSPPVRRVLKAFLPSVLGLGIVQIMALINTNYASDLQEGSVTFISLADRLLELPLSLVAVSLGTAILPSLSELWSRGDHEGFADELQKNLRALLFLCIPAAVGLFAVAPLAVSVLYERGRFTAESVLVVSGIVQIYSVTLIAASITRILSQAYYAKKNTLLPAVTSAAGLVLHLILAPKLMALYGLNGLVLSTSIAALLNGSSLLLILIFTKGFVFDGKFVWFLGRCALGTVPMYFVAYWLVGNMPQGDFLMKLAQLIMLILFCGVFYFGFTYLLRLPECTQTFGVLKRKILRRR